MLLNHARQLVRLPVKSFAPTSAEGERTSRSNIFLRKSIIRKHLYLITGSENEMCMLGK